MGMPHGLSVVSCAYNVCGKYMWTNEWMSMIQITCKIEVWVFRVTVQTENRYPESDHFSPLLLSPWSKPPSLLIWTIITASWLTSRLHLYSLFSTQQPEWACGHMQGVISVFSLNLPVASIIQRDGQVYIVASEPYLIWLALCSLPDFSFPSLTLLQPHSSPCSSCNMPGRFLPQGLCICNSFCLEFYSSRHLFAASLPSGLCSNTSLSAKDIDRQFIDKRRKWSLNI